MEIIIDNKYFCNFCKGKISIKIRISDVVLGRCHDCGSWSMLTGFINETELYNKEYFQKHYIKYEKARKEYFKNLLGFFPSFVKKGDSVFDVGCGTGIFLKVLRERADVEIAGIDISTDAVGLSRERLNLGENKVMVGDLLNKQVQNKDLVTIIDVLAHIKNAGDYLRHIIESMLEPRGRLFIKTPYKPYLLFLITQFLSYIIGGKAKGLIHVPAQIHHFTPRSLKKILEREGMEIEKFTYIPEVKTRSDITFKLIGYQAVRRIVAALSLFRTDASFCILARKK